MACAFTPSLGIVHLCGRYAVVRIIQTGEFMGKTIQLSVYRSRKVFFFDIQLVATYTSRILAL